MLNNIIWSQILEWYPDHIKHRSMINDDIFCVKIYNVIRGIESPQIIRVAIIHVLVKEAIIIIGDEIEIDIADQISFEMLKGTIDCELGLAKLGI